MPLTIHVPTAPLRCLFVVQGEGRGHMTQALALRQALGQSGHEVAYAFLGRSRHRRVPDFFLDGMEAPVGYLDSPGFAFDGQTSLRLAASVAEGAGRFQRFRASLRRLHGAVGRLRPDLIVGFFEPLVGLYNRLYRPAAPLVCVGHQYLFLHPAYRFPEGHRLDRWALTRFARLTAWGAAQCLALSLYPAPSRAGLRVLPPLLRPGVFAQPLGLRDDFLLAYVLNSGYGDAVIRWHAQHPDLPIHGFWDHRAVPDPYRPHPNLTFHQLDGERFLSMMARCRGVVCTAGFESVAEAMYLGKPALMVPVEGHYEQYCNALDAAEAGAGVWNDRFDLGRLLTYLPSYQPPGAPFRAWVESALPQAVRALEEAAGLHTPQTLAEPLAA